MTNRDLEAIQHKQAKICAEIRRIMATYRDQEERNGFVGTPGGLEHMGDVWRMLSRWDAELAQEGAGKPTA